MLQLVDVLLRPSCVVRKTRALMAIRPGPHRQFGDPPLILRGETVEEHRCQPVPATAGTVAARLWLYACSREHPFDALMHVPSVHLRIQRQ